ncbi:MAG: hypothetical protein OXI60_08360 [Acidiferrobacterales bacterium]|nr:hypothetical protein [Acidiferrobacterales bacterium]
MPTAVTLSVPTGTELAETAGIATITVTATMKAERSEDTVITLTLTGTAKSTDYTVEQLPKITIAAGQLQADADLILTPLDDNFYEGDEVISITGTAVGTVVTGTDFPLADNEAAPTLLVSSQIPNGDNRRVNEGGSVNLIIALELRGGALLENLTAGTIVHAANLSYRGRTHNASKDDYYFVDDKTPNTINFEYPANTVHHSITTPITVIDDPDEELSETVYVDVVLNISNDVSIAATKSPILGITQSDTATAFQLICRNLPRYAGVSKQGICRVSVAPGTPTPATEYSVTYNAEDAGKIDPDSMTFTVKSGKRHSKEQSVTFLYNLSGSSASNRIEYSGIVSPTTAKAWTKGFNFFGMADAGFEIDSYTPSWVPSKSFTLGDQVFRLSWVTEVPVTIKGTPSVEIELDSGASSMSCATRDGHTNIDCAYTVQHGDYDFDGVIKIPKGAVKFDGWCSQLSPKICGVVDKPLPKTSTDFTHHSAGQANRGSIYGGRIGVELNVTPQTFREGNGQQTLEIQATNVGHALPMDLTVPLKFVNISTSDEDYAIEGTQSVTIPAHQKTGIANSILFTPVDDFKREVKSEYLKIEGNSDLAMEQFVRPVKIRIIDAAGIRLSASLDEISEDGSAVKLSISAEWGDVSDTVLAKDLDIALNWGGTARTNDYSRSGGDTVTIAANARSGTTTATITPTDDSLLEGDESIVISANVPGRSVEAAELTLKDDELTPAVVIQIDEDTLSEGGGELIATVSAQFDPNVTMADNAVILTLDLGGTAVTGEDYTASWSPENKQITIQPQSNEGDNVVYLTLTPTDDDVGESEETIVVEGLAESQDIMFVVKQASIVLVDDDRKQVNIDPARELTVEEGATESYEVWLGTKPESDVTVSLSSTDATVATAVASADQSSTLEFSPTTWKTKQKVMVTGIQDNRNNSNDHRKAVIRHSTGGGGYDDVEVVELDVIVTDKVEASSFSISDASQKEGGSISFTVSRVGASDKAAAVKWMTVKDTDGANPASAADYTGQTTAKVLNFDADELSQTISVPTTDDTQDEPSETFLVELSEPDAGNSIAHRTATGTITDDDATTINLTRIATGFIAEGGSEQIEIALGRALQTEESVTVPLTVTGATVYTHYTLKFESPLPAGVSVSTDSPHSGQNPAVTLSGNGLSGVTMTLTATENTDSVERTVNIAYGSDDRAPTSTGLGGGISLMGAPISIPIADNDPQITIAAASAVEGTKAEFKVTLPADAPKGGVQIKFSTSNGRGNTDDAAYQVANSEDYTDAGENASITIPEGLKVGTISVQTTQDQVYEGDHYFTVGLTDATRYAISPSADSAIGTITDADDLPVFEFSASTSSAQEDADPSTVTLTVTKTGESLLVSSIDFATSDGSAAAPDDYAQASGSLDFAATEVNKTLMVTIVDDVLDETDEAFNVNLTVSDGGHARLGAVKQHVVTIKDNDVAPSEVTLVADADTASEGVQDSISEDGGATTVLVTAEIAGATRFSTDQSFQVTIGRDGDSAERGIDYLAVEVQEVLIKAGDSRGSVEFTLTPTNDEIKENDELVSIHSSMQGIAFTNTHIELADDEELPTVTLNLTPATIVESGTSSSSNVTAALSGKSSESVTLTVSATAISPAAAGDFTQAGTTLTIDAEKQKSTGTVSITASDNDIEDGNKKVTVSAVVSGDSGVADPEDVELTIIDDEGIPVISIDSPEVAEGDDEDSSLEFTVSLTHTTTRHVTVDYADAETGSATEGDDYTEITSGSLGFEAGEQSKTIAINVSGDLVAEGDETVAVRLSNPVNAVFRGGGQTLDGVGTITDDDHVIPTISVEDAVDVLEGDDPKVKASMSFTVALSSYSPAVVTVSYTLGGTAKKGSDYNQPDSTFVEIVPGSLTAEIEVPINADIIDEDDESVTVTLSDPVHASISTATGAGSATGKIIDDEVSVFPALADIYEGEVQSFSVSGISPAFTDVQPVTGVGSGAERGSDYRLMKTNGAELAADDFMVASKGEIAFKVQALSDNDDQEVSEHINLVLEDPTHSLNAELGTLTIRSGERPKAGVIVPKDTLILIEGGQPETYALKLTKAPKPSEKVILSAISNDPSRIMLSLGEEQSVANQVNLVFTDQDWDQAMTVTVFPQTDANSVDDFAAVIHRIADGPEDYRNLSVDSLSVAVHEPDAATNMISIDDAQGGEGSPLAFRITLTQPSAGNVSVDWKTVPRTALSDVDYLASAGVLVFDKGETERILNVQTIADETAEPDEYFLVTLSNPHNAILQRGRATGLITDDSLMLKSWNVRFARTVAEQVFDSIEGRITDQPHSSGLSGSLAGVPLRSESRYDKLTVSGGSCEDAHSAKPPYLNSRRHDEYCNTNRHSSQTYSPWQLMTALSFSLTDKQADGTSLAVWGHGVQSGFKSDDEEFSTDGTVTSAILGADWSNGESRSGIALSMSKGEGIYTAGSALEGKISSDSVSIAPWTARDVTETMTVWGAAGFGSGSVTVIDDEDRKDEAELSWNMLAIGATGTLYDASETQGFTLGITSDALCTRITSGESSSLDSASGKATRYRVGLGGNWERTLKTDTVVNHKLKLDLRHDGGDAENGWGLELGTGINWQSTESGFDFSVEGRKLLTHEDRNSRLWNLAFELAYDPKPFTKRGLSLRINQQLGSLAAENSDIRSGSHAPERNAGHANSNAWGAETAYGLEVPGGAFVGSPYLRFSHRDRSNDFTIGWRLSHIIPCPSDFSFDSYATLRDSRSLGRDNEVGVRLKSLY